MYKRIDPKEVSTGVLHSYLLGAIAPRPIAFASTIDKEGKVNLSPFSFFNVFGANPPILIFSPARRGRDNTVKHSYENVLEVPEVTINIVDYAMVQQMSLASTEYPKGVNEFVKAGLTEIPSEKVKPPRVANAPASFECKVLQVIPTGIEGGAGNLIICEVVLVHIAERVLDSNGKVDPFKLDAVARMGGDWYCRANGNALFTVPKPLEKIGIGIDQLPDEIRLSKVLTGNELAMLANIEALPSAKHFSSDANIHLQVKGLLEKQLIAEAWTLLAIV
ncbi:MAG: flavin reductase family protein [Cyclobacteriaceae bacterium]|jgi:flavin reductase (DIM6/NTAB) family NADH-FMN oxidoreductase RutF|nr:flavin reductase family protein [Cyclobacteriaceae bacterium]